MKILASITALIVAAYLLAQIFFPQGVSFVGCGVGRANSCEDYGAYLLEERDYETAKKPFEKACEAGLENSCAIAGDLYYDEQNLYKTTKDKGKSARFYSKACELGAAKACYNAAIISYKNADKKNTFAFFAKSCDLGLGEGCLNAAVASYEEKDYQGALKFFLKSCDAALAEGCQRVGLAYSKKEFGEPDLDKAMIYYDKACKLGAEFSCNVVAAMNKINASEANATK
ncbi:MAG: tetratricopeptide repeat protein [Campylobacter sp.]